MRISTTHSPSVSGRIAIGSCVCLCFCLLPMTMGPAAHAESLFAREALGEWIDGYDLRGAALGATGVGTIDPYNLSALNPAASAWAPFVLGYVGMQGTVNWTEDGEATSRRSTGSITGAGVALPIGKGWGLRFLLRPQTDGTYGIEEIAQIGSDDPEGNIHREEGSRGLLSYSADLTFRPATSVAIGVRGGLLAGSMMDETSYDFSDSGWVDTDDRRTMRCKPTFRYGAGLQWTPHSRISVGASAILGEPLTLEETYTAPAGTEYDSKQYELDHPATFAGGLAAFVSKRWRLSADVVYREWEDLAFTQDGADVGDGSQTAFRLRNTTAYGVGLERVPAERAPGVSRWSRLAWRFGYAFLPWYAEDASGDPVDEYRFSFGLGIPVKQDRGSLDFYFAYGHRGDVGDNGFAEEYVRVGMGAVFGPVLRGY